MVPETGIDPDCATLAAHGIQLPRALHRIVRRVLIPPAALQERIREMARLLAGHYPPESEAGVTPVLTGAFMFAADLGRVCGTGVQVRLHSSLSSEAPPQGEPVGRCIDAAELGTPKYDLHPEILRDSADPQSQVAETLHSNLLKTNCPVTGQPDWATVMVRYRGPRIRREALLAYLVSYRNHAEFHEQCVERMFMDIKRFCRPQALSVYARYLRRGGLDINPFRSNFETPPPNVRLLRQ